MDFQSSWRSLHVQKNHFSHDTSGFLYEQRYDGSFAYTRNGFYCIESCYGKPIKEKIIHNFSFRVADIHGYLSIAMAMLRCWSKHCHHIDIYVHHYSVSGL